jgi:hypothetical protein
MRNIFYTYDELLSMILGTYPGAASIKWLRDDLRSLWVMGAPHPQTWERRMILPSQWKRFAHDVGQKIGQEMTLKPHL